MTIQEEIFQFWDDAFKNNINSAIISIPGLGISWECKQYYPQREVNYINSPNQELTQNNIIDIDNSESNNFQILNNLFLKSQVKIPSKTLSFIIYKPPLFFNDKNEQSEFKQHIHQIFWMRTQNLSEHKTFVKRIDPQASQKQIDKIFELSGGIPTLTKFLCFNKELLDISIEEICNNPKLETIITKTTSIIKDIDNSNLLKMGLKNENGWGSKIVEALVNKTNSSTLNIVINDDYSFSENQILSKNKLTLVESQILQNFIKKITISREEIEKLKWGDNENQKFSYWAVNKTISRLNSKLEKYIIKPLYKSGYTIRSKNN